MIFFICRPGEEQKILSLLFIAPSAKFRQLLYKDTPSGIWKQCTFYIPHFFWFKEKQFGNIPCLLVDTKKVGGKISMILLETILC
jgi:hypothetical protein